MVDTFCFYCTVTVPLSSMLFVVDYRITESQNSQNSNFLWKTFTLMNTLSTYYYKHLSIHHCGWETVHVTVSLLHCGFGIKLKPLIHFLIVSINSRMLIRLLL